MNVMASAITMIILGLVLIRYKDPLWRLMKLSPRYKTTSRRTKSWDVMTTVGGVIAIIIGTIFLIKEIF